jgi:hypothetical protein
MEPRSPHRKYYLLTTFVFKSLLRPENVLSENELFQPYRTVDLGQPRFRAVNGEAWKAQRNIFDWLGGMQ